MLASSRCTTKLRLDVIFQAESRAIRVIARLVFFKMRERLFRQMIFVLYMFGHVFDFWEQR